MEDVSEQVQGEEYVPEVMEQPLEPELEAPMEQELEAPMEPPTPAPRVRVRKVKVKAPADTKPQPAPDPNYWNSRLQEHRSSQRLAKDERYGNLRIM